MIKDRIVKMGIDGNIDVKNRKIIYIICDYYNVKIRKIFEGESWITVT